jgi:putative heme-binding domain-containing protein
MYSHVRLRCMSAFVIALVGAFVTGPVSRAADDKPIRVLLVAGGCCHDYEHQKDILKEGIEKRLHAKVTIAYDPDTTTKHLNPVYNNPDWAKDFDIVIHDECSADVKDLKVIEGILKPHKDGLPGVVLHCAMHCYRSEGWKSNAPSMTPWFEFTGLQSTGHGAQLPISITFVDKDSPITKGMEDWTTVNEELYNNIAGKLLDTAHPLARGKQTVKARNGQERTDDYIVSWTNIYNGKARVFGTTIGHNNKTVADPRYLDLLTRGMLWALNRSDQKNAAGAEGAKPQAAAPAPQQVSRAERAAVPADVQKIAASLKAPKGFDLTVFGVPPEVSYPTAISATPTGELYVATDKNGSLDRAPDRGLVLKCVDTTGAGTADKITVFARMDSPRGVIADGKAVYVLHPPALTAYYDDDGDGIADRSVDLVTGIGRDLSFRGADHTTNGIRLGIDGWIYIAMGDYGSTKAVGKDGTEIQLRGGGVVRVRADGTGLERYSSGQRNIYDVAIDPLMNVFTRDNTNDGDKWNDRLSYIIPTGYYGYPSRFLHFPGEFVDCLVDYGDGSPCGSLFVDEPGLPGGLYTVEWGRNQIDHHPLTANGANFKAGFEKFMDLPRGTDMDVDGQGHIFLSSWVGAQFTYAGPNVGYVVRLTPSGYKAAPAPDLKKASDSELLKVLAGPSAVWRQAAQREILGRGDKPAVADSLVKLAQSDQPLAAKVAAIFTLEQLQTGKAKAALVELAKRDELREFALRALADRKNDPDVPVAPYLAALNDPNPRVRLVRAWGIGRLGRADAAAALAPHLADSEFLVSHVTEQALTSLRAYDVCLKALDPSTPNLIPGALRVLQSLHETQVVDGIVARLPRFAADPQRELLYRALCRLYFREADWDGSWWGTRPDTSGPYFKTADWPGTDRVKEVLASAISHESPQVARQLVMDLLKHKIEFPQLSQFVARAAATDPAFRTLMVQMLLDSNRLSNDQISLLREVALSEKESPSLRAKAIGALQKSTAPNAAEAAIDALAAVWSMEKPDSELSAALSQFLRDPRNSRVIQRFTKLTESSETSRQELGYAALLQLTTQPQRRAGGQNGGGLANPRQTASQFIEKAWSNPKSTVSLLHALARTRVDGFNGKVTTLEKDSNSEVAKAAMLAATQLGLNAGPGDLIESLPYEVVVSRATASKGEASLGKELFTRQGCVACHTVSASEGPKGPFLGGIATRYSRTELCESILKPSAKIAQGFETQFFQTADGDVIEGFVSKESGDEVEVRNTSGTATVIKKKDIKRRGRREFSIMPEGLIAKLTPRDLSNLLAYLESLQSN